MVLIYVRLLKPKKRPKTSYVLTIRLKVNLLRQELTAVKTETFVLLCSERPEISVNVSETYFTLYADEHDMYQAVLIWLRIKPRMERDSLKIIYLLWVCRHLQCSKTGDNIWKYGWLLSCSKHRHKCNVREDDRFACFESIEMAINCFSRNTRLRVQLLPTRNKIKVWGRITHGPYNEQFNQRDSYRMIQKLDRLS